jgi:hypothetical protein
VNQTPPAPLRSQPVVDRIERSGSGPDALRDYLAYGTRPWGRVAVRLSGPVTLALWAVVAADLAVSVWLTLVVEGAAPCSGLFCTAATWGHPVTVLTITATGLVTLGGAALVSRGLSEVRSTSMPVIVLGASIGIAGVIGLVALAVVAAVAVGLTITVLLTLIERI